MIENIILDLDHTLIHCPESIPKSMAPILRTHPSHLRHHYVILGNYVYIIFERPFLKQFLQSLQGKRIAIWTAADQSYADFIVKNIIQPYLNPDQKIYFVWSREACDESSSRFGVLKDLDMVFERYGNTFKRENTLIIDDNPDLKTQRNNVFVIKKFFMTNQDDIELLKLIG